MSDTPSPSVADVFRLSAWPFALAATAALACYAAAGMTLGFFIGPVAAMLALPLWITALESLAAREVPHCTTLVSAANTGILNLYARLGFHFNSTLFGFRKFL